MYNSFLCKRGPYNTLYSLGTSRRIGRKVYCNSLLTTKHHWFKFGEESHNVTTISFQLMKMLILIWDFFCQRISWVEGRPTLWARHHISLKKTYSRKTSTNFWISTTNRLEKCVENSKWVSERVQCWVYLHHKSQIFSIRTLILTSSMQVILSLNIKKLSDMHQRMILLIWDRFWTWWECNLLMRTISFIILLLMNTF